MGRQFFPIIGGLMPANETTQKILLTKPVPKGFMAMNGGIIWFHKMMKMFSRGRVTSAGYDVGSEHIQTNIGCEPTGKIGHYPMVNMAKS